MTIPKELIDEFRATCADRCAEDGFGYVGSDDMPTTTADGTEVEWEYHAANYNPDDSLDIYAMFEAVGDEYEFEEVGWDSFCVSRL